MILTRDQLQGLLNHERSRYVFAEAKVIQVYNKQYPSTLWVWEVEFTLDSMYKQEIAFKFHTRKCKIYRAKFSDKKYPRVGDTVLLHSRVTPISRRFRADRAKIIAIIK